MNDPVPDTTALTGTLWLKTILVAVDLSPYSEGTARYATSIARPFGASIVPVHVQPSLAANELLGPEAYETLERQRRQVREALRHLADTLREDHPR